MPAVSLVDVLVAGLDEEHARTVSVPTDSAMAALEAGTVPVPFRHISNLDFATPRRARLLGPT